MIQELNSKDTHGVDSQGEAKFYASNHPPISLISPRGKQPWTKVRSSSMPSAGLPKVDSSMMTLIPTRSGRCSMSKENNILLDAEILMDYPTQALVLTVLVSLYLIACAHNHMCECCCSWYSHKLCTRFGYEPAMRDQCSKSGSIPDS